MKMNTINHKDFNNKMIHKINRNIMNQRGLPIIEIYLIRLEIKIHHLTQMMRSGKMNRNIDKTIQIITVNTSQVGA